MNRETFCGSATFPVVVTSRDSVVECGLVDRFQGHGQGGVFRNSTLQTHTTINKAACEAALQDAAANQGNSSTGTRRLRPRDTRFP
jgi:hypothetical protein